MTSSKCKVFGSKRELEVGGPAGETLLHLFSGLHKQEVNLEARKLLFFAPGEHFSLDKIDAIFGFSI